MTKPKRSALALRAAALLGRKVRTKPPSGGTLLTGVVRPIPDNRPDIKLLDNCIDLFQTKTIKNCITLLKDILPYWIKYQLKYRREAEEITLNIRSWLIALRANSNREISPIPSDLLGIRDWITTNERALKRKGKKETLTADTKLCGVLALLLAGKIKIERSITAIARKAGVSRKTAYKSPMFMSLYDEVRPSKTTKKGSRFSFDENRDSQKCNP
jgi:hypothetical protein